MLRSIGTRLGEVYLGCLQKSESNVRVSQGFGCENMNVPVHKNRATSRRWRELNFQRRNIGLQRRDVPKCQASNRDVGIQRRDVPESFSNPTCQCCDVTES